ncbi:hypothetical protein DSM112329_00717 [Paraconexibacter sp. AEG42_29]|uniref:HTH tetR-type domain-containing protein n=1 Tax=Paraconexibacter sp. AEG42_29 TaxID=2997339 RepID=A0AAU7AQP3_9ACTN
MAPQGTSPAGASPVASARGEATRVAILAAGLSRFTAYGYRRTSMDDIAAAAGCSRATIYFHFGTKEEVFRALAQHQHDLALEAMRAASLAEHADVGARVLAMLEARFGGFVALAHGSPHGAEILAEGGRVSADIVAAAHAQTLALLGATLRAAAKAGELDLKAAGLSAPAAAQAILDGAHGAKTDAALTPDAYRRRLRAVVRLLVRGLSPA